MTTLFHYNHHHHHRINNNKITTFRKKQQQRLVLSFAVLVIHVVILQLLLLYPSTGLLSKRKGRFIILLPSVVDSFTIRPSSVWTHHHHYHYHHRTTSRSLDRINNNNNKARKTTAIGQSLFVHHQHQHHRPSTKIRRQIRTILSRTTVVPRQTSTTTFLAMSTTVSIPSTDVTNTTETNNNNNEQPATLKNNKNNVVVDNGSSLVSLSSLSSAQLLPSSNNILPSSYSMNPIQRVAIVGGTHGNEYTGVWVVREWEEQIQKKKNTREQQQDTNVNDNNKQQQQQQQQEQEDPIIDERYPSLVITTLIGNPVAHKNNRRFIDVDLNRQFDLRTLQYDYELMEHTERTTIPIEIQRAIEINNLLGPKTRTPIPDTTGDYDDTGYDQSSSSLLSNKDKDNMDLVIDLHSTTAAMDCTLIIPEGDVLMIQAAAYVMYKCNQLYSASHSSSPSDSKTTTTTATYPINYETRILIDHVRSCHSTRPFLPSIGKHEFTIEVGPVPQGVLRHDAIIKTKTALQYLLEFLEIYNSKYNNSTTTSSSTDNPIESILEEMYPNGIVPCFNDLGKLPWPSHPNNPNFPLWIIHESIQDNDYQVVRTGDPLFVTLQGDTIYYDGQYGNEVYLAFINEGGYYYASSGTGICLLQKTSVNYTTGILINYTIPTISSAVVANNQ